MYLPNRSISGLLIFLSGKENIKKKNLYFKNYQLALAYPIDLSIYVFDQMHYTIYE